MTDTTFLTTEEVAKLLNVHINTIARWIKSGKLPSTKIGREYRIPRDAIENRVNRVASGTRIVAVANQKGGVAKTTTTLNLAAGLASRGILWMNRSWFVPILPNLTPHQPTFSRHSFSQAPLTAPASRF